jgi:hypothetical protein
MLFILLYTLNAYAQSNVAVNGIASSQSQKSGYEAIKGCDNNVGSKWMASSTAVPQWWKVDLGSNISISSTAIVWEKSGTGNVYKYKIETSLDNSSWTLRKDLSGNTSTSQIQTQIYTPTITARYVRISIISVPVNSSASFFEARVFSTSAQYTITKNAQFGTIGTDFPGPNYNAGTNVKVTVVPNTGYRFDYWSGDLSGSTNPALFIMNSNKSLTANFIKTWKLKITNDGNGTTVPNDSLVVDNRQPYAIDATPKTGKIFYGWTITSGTTTADIANSLSASTIVSLQRSNATIKANFLSIPPISIVADDHGFITSNSTLSLGVNGSASISAVAATGYKFDNWTQTGSATVLITSPNSSNTTITLQKAGTQVIRANFIPSASNLTPIKWGTVKCINVAPGMALSPTYMYTFTEFRSHPERTAYYNFTLDSLLKRAKDAGYTHVQAQFEPSAWDWETGTMKFYPDAKIPRRSASGVTTYIPYNQFEEAFKAADRNGLILIPGIPFGTGRCTSWSGTGLSNITLNRVDGNESIVYMATPFADDPDFDPLFNRLLNRIRDEYNSAKQTFKIQQPYLEYFNLDCDEMMYSRTVNGVNEGGLMIGFSNTNEQNFIAAHGSTPFAIKQLYAYGLYKNISRIQTQLFNQTKTMISAGMIDPQHYGGTSNWYVPYLNASMKIANDDGEDVLDLPGLTATQQEFVKRNLILQPWQYDLEKNSELVGLGQYDAYKAAEYFVRKGYNFLYWNSYDAYPDVWGPLIDLSTGNTINQTYFAWSNLAAIKNNLDVGMKYADKCLGYIEGHWPCFRDKGHMPENTNCRCGTYGYYPDYWNPNLAPLDPMRPIEFSMVEYLQHFSQASLMPVFSGR